MAQHPANKSTKRGRPNCSAKITTFLLDELEYITQASADLIDNSDRLPNEQPYCRSAGAKSPNLNAFAERWVRSVKEECLSKVILFGEESLSGILTEYSRRYLKGKEIGCSSLASERRCIGRAARSFVVTDSGGLLQF